MTFVFGLFDNIFDFDNNGELDSLEKAAEFSFVVNMIENEEDDSHKDDDFCDDYESDEDDDFFDI